jgi:hypothetical protein
MLSKQAIEEFQDIYLKTYGKEISFSEAEVQAEQFLRLFKLVAVGGEAGPHKVVPAAAAQDNAR